MSDGFFFNSCEHSKLDISTLSPWTWAWLKYHDGDNSNDCDTEEEDVDSGSEDYVEGRWKFFIFLIVVLHC